MLKPKIEELLNKQLNFEIYSAHLYKSMASYCDSLDLKGFANWFKVQAKEETLHSEKLYDYIVDRDGRVLFSAVLEPKQEWSSVNEAFEDTLKHENIVTERVNELMTAAMAENDHGTASFLKWFIDEQIEEEANDASIIKQLKLLNGSGEGLFMMDKELSARVFNPASAAL